jgi:drug/metabolite transporter (DMT)-like permease
MIPARSAAEFVALAALWGASFLFMRIAAPDFGPVALTFLRVAGASVLLLPILLWRREGAALRAHGRDIALVGLVNSAGPFLLLMAAALVLNAGVLGIFNAASPLWAALVAWAWLGQRPGVMPAAGLVVGFAGVFWLAGDKAFGGTGAVAGPATVAAVGACLAATVLYGFAAVLTRRRLVGVPPMAVAAGSQLAAAAVLAVPAVLWWPATLPGARAWFAAAVLAFACTGLAYILYFRLIARLGATAAISVTFLIPAFAVAWGWLVLDEAATPSMAFACGVIVLGTSLATGIVGRRRGPPPGTARSGPSAPAAGAPEEKVLR